MNRLFCRAGAAVAAAALIAGAPPVLAADAVLYRIFLRDGGTVVSYGDFARVADRVVLSVPIGTGDSPQLQLVSIPESSVDWAQTDRYADAVRARHYASSRGEDDFHQLSNDVARALNEVALTNDPARRVALADDARRKLAEWPAAHYGYRARDVAQLSELLEEVVSELRVAAGQSRFELKLVAPPVEAPTAPILPDPSPRESIEMAFVAAHAAAEPAERMSLLESISRSLASLPADAAPDAPDARWAAEARARAAAALASEVAVQRAYAQLSARTLSRAAERARRADVRAIEGLFYEVMKADARLGRARPDEVAALLVALDAQKTAAQRLRLARDAWALRVGALKQYRKQLSQPLERLTRSRRWLEDIRQLAGPSPKAVARLEERAAIAGRELAMMKPPPELAPVHSLLNAACGFATRAASSRRKAILSGDMPAAWEASSAASGALVMLQRAAEDLERLASPPQLQ